MCLCGSQKRKPPGPDGPGGRNIEKLEAVTQTESHDARRNDLLCFAELCSVRAPFDTECCIGVKRVEDIRRYRQLSITTHRESFVDPDVHVPQRFESFCIERFEQYVESTIGIVLEAHSTDDGNNVTISYLQVSAHSQIIRELVCAAEFYAPA